MDDIDHTESALRDFDEAEGAVVEAEQRLTAATERLAEVGAKLLDTIRELRSRSEAEADPRLMAVLRHIYWHQPRVYARELAKAAGYRHLQGMLAAIGPVPSGIPCSRCGAELMRTSRSWEPSKFGPPLCGACSRLKAEIRTRGQNIQSLRQRMVNDAKVPAPVRDLRVAAALVMAYPPFGTGVPYGDDHNGFWSGWENAKGIHDSLLRMAAADSDVVEISCVSATRLVNSASEVVGWDAARTRDLVDPITEEPAHAVIARLATVVREVTSAAKARSLEVYGGQYEPTEDEVRGLWERPPLWI